MMLMYCFTSSSYQTAATRSRGKTRTFFYRDLIRRAGWEAGTVDGSILVSRGGSVQMSAIVDPIIDDELYVVDPVPPDEDAPA